MRLCYVKLVRHDGLVKVFQFGRRPVAFLQRSKYPGCIRSLQDVSNISKVLVDII